MNLNSSTALGTGAGTVILQAGTLNAPAGPVTFATNNPITFNGNFTFGGTNDMTFGTGAITNAGNRTITLNGTGSTLTFGGVMTNTSNAVQTTTVNGAGNTLVLGGYELSNNATNRIDVITCTANVTITGAVTNGGTATASGLTKNGTGTLTLKGANTYTGATTVNTGGTLALVGGSQTSAITVNSGAFLGFTPGSPTTSTAAVNLIAGSKVRIIGTPSGSVTLLTTTATITGTPVLETPLPGYDLVVEGTNTLKLNATSPYAGWAAGNAGGGAANLDYDNDGVSNGVEYFMNVTIPGFTAMPAMVGTTVTWPNGGNIPSADYGTQFVVQTSTDLTNWTDVASGDPNLSNTPTSVSYTLTDPGKSFARLKVTPN
jgi:autotransporter-associated beta strand protein